MPQVKGPDGATFNFPDGTPPDQMQAALAQHYGPGGHGDGAIAGQPDLGGVGNAVLAGGMHFVHQLPFVGDAALTGARLIANQVNGEGGDWQNANHDVHTMLDSAQQQHPVSSTVGGVAGGVDAAVVGGGALKAAEGLPIIGDGLAAISRATQLRKGQMLANAARMAAAGGAQGAAQGGGEQAAAGNPGGIIPAALGGAAIGAPAGAVGGTVVQGLGTAASKLAPGLTGKVASTLAKVFGETASDIQSLWQSHIDETGRAPSMAELATYKQLGVINDFKQGSGTIAEALQARQAAAAGERSGNMVAQFTTDPATGTRISASPAEISNIRTAQGDLDYPQSRAAPDFQIPTAESEALGGVSPADHIASEILPQAGLGKVDRVRIMGDLQNGSLTAQDAQLIRSGLSESLSRNYSPGLKGLLADFDSFTHTPENAASAAPLDRASDRFASNSRVVAGAEHGATITGASTPGEFGAVSAGNPSPEFAQGQALGANDKLAATSSTPQGATALAGRLATDQGLMDKLTTTFGPDTAAALQRMGAAETRAASNLQAVSGGAPKIDDKGIADVAQVSMALASHGLGWKLIHAAKAITGLEMPAAVQEKVAQYLTDPKMVRQGLNLLTKAGASASALRRAALTAAGASGTGGGDVAGGLDDHGGVTIESVTPATPAELAQAGAQ